MLICFQNDLNDVNKADCDCEIFADVLEIFIKFNLRHCIDLYNP